MMQGQMGTESEDPRELLKFLLKKLKFSYKGLAILVYEETNDSFYDDDEKNIEKLSESIKKQVSRNLTGKSKEKLNLYIEILKNTHEYKLYRKIDKSSIKRKNELPLDIFEGLCKISTDLKKRLNKKNY